MPSMSAEMNTFTGNPPFVRGEVSFYAGAALAFTVTCLV